MHKNMLQRRLIIHQCHKGRHELTFDTLISHVKASAWHSLHALPESCLFFQKELEIFNHLGFKLKTVQLF